MADRPVLSVEELQELLDTAFPGSLVPYTIEEITDSSVRMTLRGRGYPTPGPVAPSRARH